MPNLTNIQSFDFLNPKRKICLGQTIKIDETSDETARLKPFIKNSKTKGE